MIQSFKSLFIHFIFLVFSLTLLMGCSHYLMPTPQVVNTNRITEFTIDSNIELINLQSENTKIFEIKTTYKTYKGTLAEWTEKAIELLSDELTKRGGSINENDPKILKLAVTEYKRVVGMSRISFNLKLHLEMGNGYKADYYAENKNAPIKSSGERGFGGAITLAITDMLNDKEFVSYLKE